MDPIRQKSNEVNFRMRWNDIRDSWCWAVDRWSKKKPTQKATTATPSATSQDLVKMAMTSKEQWCRVPVRTSLHLLSKHLIRSTLALVCTIQSHVNTCTRLRSHRINDYRGYKWASNAIKINNRLVGYTTRPASDGRNEGWTDGRKDRRTNGGKDERTTWRTNKEKRRLNGQTEGRTNGRTDERTK